ncbi:hypothetical protein AMATHDRAFT_58795 [Amanita thiersii Skay4041]|uniref:Heme peroxidase n=1 Tax=Amanita thiersii Skay4041 TaxID=703135 RepID=A0A2A9NKZ9_9AGAR|nr:hypothetical protein AMATHDRAFT_58795 [Amanita thiersii Skay4041]
MAFEADKSIDPLDHHPQGTRSSILRALPQDKLIDKVYDLIKKPPVHWSDLPAYLDAIMHQRSIGLDDRLMLLEKLLVTMATLDEEAPDLSLGLQKFVIDLLYKDLPHPPNGFLSSVPSIASVQPDTAYRTYAYRPADGSNYNPYVPTIGKVGHPYARSVPTTRSTPKWALPDPGLVFDTLLKRDDFVPHPGGISSLFFAFADLVIHDIFRTGRNGFLNNTSSYLDLSILYGTSDVEVARVRRKDGTGRLWNDVFADGRLLHMPPASCALLVLLSRNHNYIAQKILDINEYRTYSNPPPTDERLRELQDDEIFHRARLVNCGYFMHIILGDYVGAILGLVRDGSPWRLDPLMAIRDKNHEVTPRGEGNVVSIEFNLLYRWHSTLSLQDTKWTDQMVKDALGGVDPAIATVETLRQAAPRLAPNPDVKTWEFGGLKRTASGHFLDADLARILHNAIEWRAGAFKARGIPEALRVVEIMTIQQARDWNTCTLNEFRKFLGLKPYASFKEWNPDANIASAAAALYKDIDNLELHVGLQAEETKEPIPGAGLCPGYTISRAILADAVCLTRGDRFYTTDFTPGNLTSWGYQDCQYDRNDGSYGGLLTKLFYRTLPDYFPSGSAYAHFPFLDPVWMHDHLSKERKEVVNQYNWTRPQLIPPSIPIESHEGVNQVLSSGSEFISDAEDRLYDILTFSESAAGRKEGKKELMSGVQIASKTIFSNKAGDYFARKTEELIQTRSFTRVNKSTRYIDIVQDVINVLPVYWLSESNILRLPLNSTLSDDGMSDVEISRAMATVGRYVFINDDPTSDWHLRLEAREFAQLVENHNNDRDGFVHWMTTFFTSMVRAKLETEHQNTLRRLYTSDGSKHKDLAKHVFAAAVPTAAYFSKALAHVIDYYLSTDKVKEREHILKLADSGNTAGVMTYVKEALRAYPVISGFYRSAIRNAIVGDVKVESTQRVHVSIDGANCDPTVFPSDYTMTSESPVIIGLANTGFFSPQFFENVVPAVLKVIFRLNHVQQAPGTSDQLYRISEEYRGVTRMEYVNEQGQVTPWPTCMTIEYA